MGIVKTPFSDQVGADSVPRTASKGAKTNYTEIPGTPGRDGSGVAPEVLRDTAVTSKSPSTSGSIKTTFKDAVS